MQSDFTVNKYLHTVASGWIFINIHSCVSTHLTPSPYCITKHNEDDASKDPDRLSRRLGAIPKEVKRILISRFTKAMK